MTNTIFEISVKLKKNVKLKELPQIKSSKDCEKVLRPYFDKNTFYIQEEFIVVFLNNSNRVVGHQRISKGGISATVVDTRVIFSTAIKCFASAIIISHNHPSGNLNPSRADIELTKKIKKIGEIMDIKLLDHIIITDEEYLSFADDGLL